jgi:cell division protein FtsQ
MIDEPPTVGEPASGAAPSRRRAGSASPAETDAPRWKRRLRLAAIATAALTLLTTPWWGPPALSTFDFFHVRRVEIDGVRYTDPDELMPLLQLDTLASVWMPFDSLEARVTAHPMVLSATARRQLPGTIVVTVTERTPVALVPGDGRLVAVDVRGDELPIDPVRAPVDVPVAATADSMVLRVLDQLRQDAPTLWLRVSQARRDGPHDLRLTLGRLTLRTRDDVTVARLGDILPVEADLARRRLRPTELDLRFRDQVIARLP